MKLTFFLTGLIFSGLSFAQEAGNANYQMQIRYPENNISLNLPSSNDIIIDVKGMANVKADTYVAVFNVLQVGKSADEVNDEIDKRINAVLKKAKNLPGVSAFVDMLTFVPVYEYQTEKKVFSKRTYNEIPTGFELKKNIHIEYKNPEFLNNLISFCAENEIFDLVKVEYFASNLETVKKDLMNKAKNILKEKEKNYSEIVGIGFTNFDKQLADVYSMKYPAEMYKSYQAYASTSLDFKRNSQINQADKTTTLYYQPVIDKEFDFVINPKIVEPVIQVMYEIKLRIIRPVKDLNKESGKEYYIVTPNGDVKLLNLK